MKKISLEEIRSYSTHDLIEGLRLCKYSLLTSLGFKKLHSEMACVGSVCQLFASLTGVKGASAQTGLNGLKRRANAYLNTKKLLYTVTPISYKCDFPHPDVGMVVGFNHPSLGEMLRCIYLCIDEYRYQQNLFPVNLPWYEALMPIANDLEEIGVSIVPIITPSTRARMEKYGDAETMQVVDELSRRFNKYYLEKCVEFIKTKNNVWVAPSATRQRYVFATHDAMKGLEKITPQTMTLLATTLERNGVGECLFLPLGIIPPENFNRGLNLFKSYKIVLGESLSMDDARENIHRRCKNNSGREFEFLFLMKLVYALVRNSGSDFVCPPLSKKPNLNKRSLA